MRAAAGCGRSALGAAWRLVHLGAGRLVAPFSLSHRTSACRDAAVAYDLARLKAAKASGLDQLKVALSGAGRSTAAYLALPCVQFLCSDAVDMEQMGQLLRDGMLSELAEQQVGAAGPAERAPARCCCAPAPKPTN